MKKKKKNKKSFKSSMRWNKKCRKKRNISKSFPSVTVGAFGGKRL